MFALLTLASRAAQMGGRSLVDFRTRGLSLETTKKPDGTLVTEADARASRIIQRVLKAGDPYAFILDEEAVNTHDLERPKYFWIVDPLDGTSAFIEGADTFCTMIARMQGNIPVLGVIYFPVSNTLFWGGYRQGAWMKVGDQPARELSGRRIQLMEQVRMTTPTKVVTRALFMRIAQSLNVQAVEIDQPSGGLYTGILNNGHDLVITRPGRPAVWDTAAGHAILLAAGGKIVDLHGDPLNYQEGTHLKYGSVAVIDPSLLPVILHQLPPRNELIP
ncbi:hypothetical protein HQ487_00290 [Candidatus Uhrbacteria bacterium]|nr:hypothetical protein [Candidatus Uhrbacteria bacterium]